MLNDNQTYDIEPIVLIHEVSDTEYYIGTSINGNDINVPIWKIKKISKVDGIWNLTKYPNGDQSYNFIWYERASYDYV